MSKVSPMSTAPSVETANYHPPSWEAILAAHARIAPRIHRTPVLRSTSLNAMTGAQLFFKCENLQKTGSFKIRGASNAILSLTEQEAAQGIVTQSSGNHGAAVACAAAWRGIPAWIVMPRNAPAVKAKAVEGYGGKVVFCEPTVTARKATCDHVQAETSAHLVWERMKIIIEPSSAVAIAPLLRPGVVASLNLPKRADAAVPKLGVIFSGGNVDLSSLPWK